MRLDRLKIDGFKNLNTVEIDFDEDEPSTVLIGLNGTGKSNVLEALVVIFRALDLKEPIPFRCFLRYHCKGRWIEVDNRWSEGNSSLKLTVDGKSISASMFAKGADEYLPNHVFGYYSGGSRRFEVLFDKHQSRYYGSVIKPGAEEWTDPREPALRRLFYCRPVYGQLALLSYFAYPDDDARRFLCDDMGINGFYSALIILKRPQWAKSNPGETIRQHGDPRFWYAAGVVKHLLEALWEHAIAPMRMSANVTDDYRGQSSLEEQAYIYIKDEATLRKLAEPFGGQQAFFALLETLDISDLVREVRIWVNRDGAEAELPFHEISDGEKQLLTVLGLMKFTGHTESLFLLDEPDTHLNPAWKWNYLELIEKVAGPDNKSHVVITTHDPLTIAGLKAKQVQLLWKGDDDWVRAKQPDVDPRGLGVAGILTEVFGMETTLDPDTQGKLDRRNELFALPDEQRSPVLAAEMEGLTTELAELGFKQSSRDPLYALFLRRMERRKAAKRPVFTPHEMEMINAVADQIIGDLLGEASP